jgi:pSer/pThr/pTyr-binding forkhead associated (FHA) protein
MNVRLKVLSGGSAGKEVKLQEGEFFIGRGDGCHLRPKSDAISRKHCVLVVDEKQVLIRDLQSRNGTLVNGEKIEGDRQLQRGDRLTVGPLEFEVILQSAGAAAAAQPAASQPASPPPAASKPVASKPAESAQAKPSATPEKPTDRNAEKNAEKNVPKTTSPAAGKQPTVPAAAKRPAASGAVADDDIFGWLEEGDEVDRAERMTDPATRQFRAGDKKKAEVSPEGETVDLGNDEKGDTKAAKKKKKEFGKLPPIPDQSKKHDNSQAAAADALKQFFKRS